MWKLLGSRFSSYFALSEIRDLENLGRLAISVDHDRF